MKKTIFTFLAVAILVAGAVYLLLAGRSGTPPSATPIPTSVPSSASESEDIPVTGQRDLIEVSIENFAFSPAVLNIKSGTAVKWTNRDKVEHTVTSEGVDKTLNSRLLGEGESFSFTFNQSGIYSYLCAPHPNMRGSVTVTQ